MFWTLQTNMMTSYYKEHDKFYVAVDIIIFGFDGERLNLLLIKRNFPPAEGKWSLMGGFLNNKENLDQAAKRVLFTLTGLNNVFLEQLLTYGDVYRDPGERVISVAYYALIKIDDYDKNLMEKHLIKKKETLEELPLPEKGIVKDSISGEPVENTQIIDALSREGTISNTDGSFILKVSSGLPVELILKHVAYETKTITIESGQESGLVIWLTPKITYLTEINVIGSFENEKPYRTETISSKTIKKTSISDIGNLLRREPNVSGVKKGAAGVDPVVRGFKYAQ